MSEKTSNTAKRKEEFASAIAGVEQVAKRLATHANEIIDIHNSDKSESELLKMKLALLELELVAMQPMVDVCDFLTSTHQQASNAWVMLDDGVGAKLAELDE